MRAAEALLLSQVFGAAEAPLARSCAGYLAVCPRFRPFLEQYAGKIRKKARAAGDAEGQRDLLAELAAAASLLADRRFTVEYEKYAAEKRRGPDLTAAFRVNTLCNIEIKRLRAAPTAERIAEVVCAKLRQLPPSAINVVLIAAEPGLAGAPPLAEAMAPLRARAEAKDDEFFQRRGFREARDFSRQLPLLSGVLCDVGWQTPATTTRALWRHPAARHPLPPELARALTARQVPHTGVVTA